MGASDENNVDARRICIETLEQALRSTAMKDPIDMSDSGPINYSHIFNHKARSIELRIIYLYDNLKKAAN